MKQDMNINMKLKCMIYKFHLLAFLIITVAFSVVTYSIGEYLNIDILANKYTPIYVIVFELIIYVAYYCILLNNTKVISGNIYKKHRHYRNFPGEGGHYEYRARAQSYDKKYTTPKNGFLEPRYFKYEKIPVKIIIKKGKAIDFYIDDYSFVNDDNINEKIKEKKK